MPVPEQLLRDSSVTGPLGSLALSVLRPHASVLGLRAIRWAQGLERLGVNLPFFVVHDVGLLFAAPRLQVDVGYRVDPSALSARIADGPRRLATYKNVIDEIREGEVARKGATLKMTDDLIVVVLARLLGTVAARLTEPAAYRALLPADAALFDAIDPQLPALLATTPRDFEAAALEGIGVARLFVLTMVDALDLDTLRLFGMLGTGASPGALAQVDLLAALESPEANDIVNFSLEILPSVLETKTHPAAGTSALHGYCGLGTRGSVDSIVLTELAWDDLELARRLIDNEVLYFAREQSRDERNRIHYLLVDASASMRGDRQTFARGMAIATGKKLLLEGEDVAFRFFDSRLYELQRAKCGHLPTAYLLSFRGERGRNPARVFAALATELDLATTRDPRSPVIHLFTHAALHIPRDMVQAVRDYGQIAAVFILPSGGKLDLDYLDLLDAHWVVDHDALTQRGARVRAARTILDGGGTARQSLTEGDTAPLSQRAPSSVRPDPDGVRGPVIARRSPEAAPRARRNPR